jgi:hypothetical protein
MKREAELQLEKNKFGEKRRINRMKDGSMQKQIALAHKNRVYNKKEKLKIKALKELEFKQRKEAESMETTG